MGLYEWAYQGMKRSGNVNHKATVNVALDLLRVYNREQHWEKAKILCWEYCIPSEVENLHNRKIRASLGGVLENQNNLKDAEEAYLSHMRTCIRQYSSSSPATREMELALGKLYTKPRRFEEAEEIYWISFNNCKESLGFVSEEAHKVAFMLGETLSHQEKSYELEVVFRCLFEGYVLGLDETAKVLWNIFERLEQFAQTINSPQFAKTLFEILLALSTTRFGNSSEVTWSLAQKVSWYYASSGYEDDAENLLRLFYLGNQGIEDLTQQRDREVSCLIAQIRRVPGHFDSEMELLREMRMLFADGEYQTLCAAKILMETVSNIMDNGAESIEESNDSHSTPDSLMMSSTIEIFEVLFYAQVASQDEGACDRDLIKAEKLHRMLFEAARDSQKFGLQGWWTLVMLKRLGEDLQSQGHTEDEEQLYLEMMSSFKGALGKCHDRTIEMVRYLQNLYTREELWEKKECLEKDMLEGVDEFILERASRATEDSIGGY